MSTLGYAPPAPPPIPERPPLRLYLARGERLLRTFTIRPWQIGLITVAVVGLSVTYLAATAYLVIRDRDLGESLAGETNLRLTYEKKIAALKLNVEHLAKRQKIDQQAFDAKIEDLLGNQADLDKRQDMIAELSRAATGAGLLPKAIPLPSPRPSHPATAIDPISTGSIPQAQPQPVQPVTAPGPGANLDLLMRPQPIAQLGRVEMSLADLARDQVAYVEGLANVVAMQNEKFAAVLQKLGHAPPDQKGARNVGGPLVAIAEDADPEAFRVTIAAVSEDIELLANLRETAARLPLARPIEDLAITSRFGKRRDPFVGRTAMHTGIDFNAPSGHPIHAAAGGKVVTAAYSGGYGRMVEIDHGRGIRTRYGHLSRILVKRGQAIEKGALIGRGGSTGRSTGPHLHYEIRVRGKPIDPMPYIKAGAELTPLLDTDHFTLGG